MFRYVVQITQKINRYLIDRKMLLNTTQRESRFFFNLGPKKQMDSMMTSGEIIDVVSAES